MKQDEASNQANSRLSSNQSSTLQRVRTFQTAESVISRPRVTKISTEANLDAIEVQCIEEEGSDVEEIRENRVQKEKMLEGGFTLIEEDETKRKRGRDEFGDVVRGASEEEMKKYAERLQKRARLDDDS